MTSGAPIRAMAGKSWCDNLLLDLDGTLVDSLPGIEFSARQAMEACGITPGAHEFRSLIGPPIREILRVASGCADPSDLDRLEVAFRTAYDGGGWRKTVLYPEVVETLQEIHRWEVHLFVVTNKPRVPAQKILAHLGIEPFIDALYTPDRRQPAFRTKGEIVCQLQLDSRLDRNHTLYVGDSLDDAHAAAAAGCKFAGVRFGYGDACAQRKHPVHFTLGTFRDIIPVLFKVSSPVMPDPDLPGL